MKRALVTTAAILVALPLAVTGAAAWYLNGDAVKARLIDEVRRATGRELTIAGPVRLAWSLTPTIEVDDVSLANPPGFAAPRMAHAASIRARLAVLPLLERRVVVDRIAVVSPDILLATDAAGRPNWRFDPPSPPPAAPAPATASTPGPRWRVELGAIDVTSGVVQALQRRFEVPSLTLDPRTGGLRGTVRAAGAEMALSGTVPLSGPLADGTDVRLAGPGFTASLVGNVATVAIPDLTALSALAGRALPPLRGVSLSARLPGPVDLRLGFTAQFGRLQLTEAVATAPSLTGPAQFTAAGSIDRLPLTLSAMIGSLASLFAPGPVAVSGLRLAGQAGDVTGDLVWTNAGRPSVRGALSSSRLDLDALAPATPPPPPAAAPAAPAAAPSAAAAPAPPPEPARVIPDTKLPLDLLRTMDADLQLSAADIRYGGQDYRTVQAHAALVGGTLRLDPASMAVGGATAHGTLEVQAAAEPPAIHVTVAAPGLPAGGAADAPGTLDLHADLAGTGGTLRALAATLTGQAGLALTGGHIDNAVLERLLAAPIRALGLRLDAGGGTTIRCATVRADATAGIVHLSTLALDTSKLALEGGGEVDLGRETIDLHLRPQLRLGGGLSVPLRVRGTLAAPKASLDPGAIASGRVGIVLGGPPPADVCGPAGSEPPPPPRALKPADLLRGLLR